VLNTITSASDSAALTQFLAGLNQERARQFSLAVVSFQATLKTGSQLIPPETIGEHLEKIRAEHPQDFEQGMKLTLSAPADASDSRTSSPSPPATYPTVGAGRVFLGPNGRPVPATEETTIAIPAKPTPKPPASDAK
jgi:hypothetical protein